MIDRKTFLEGALALGVASVMPRGAFAASGENPADGAGQGWWMQQPIRWLQTNLRETDAALDPQAFVKDVADFGANVLLMSAGGISAHYPSKVPLAYVSPWLPAGKDMFGAVVREAHARGIRVVGRWDFSKARRNVYDAHPDWFFRSADGKPDVYNGLYSTCINGGWYGEKALEILTEALERYPVDGFFFNMFSNPVLNYSHQPIGLCHCDNCVRLFRDFAGTEIPAERTEQYRLFLKESGLRASRRIQQLIKARRPDASVAGAAEEVSDIVFSESKTALKTLLPMWPYSSADNTNQALNSFPDKLPLNESIPYIATSWRFAAISAPESRSRIWQGVANGGGAAFLTNATLADYPDKRASNAAARVYRWLREHEGYYVGQESEARVLLLAPGGPGAGIAASPESYRGLYRLLSELHIPFAAANNLDWLGKREFDLVIAPGATPAALESYVRGGGRLIIASPTEPGFAVAPVVKRWEKPDGAYFRVRDKARFPSLAETEVFIVYGDYLQLDGTGPITFVPPSMYGPPEFVHVDWKDTDYPGLVTRALGRGTVAWLPWELGNLYYLHSSEAHAGLFSDLVDQLLPEGRQVRTNAHPLVQVTLMRQGQRRLLHLVNLTGHADTAYFDPAPMRDIRIDVKLPFARAGAVVSAQALPVARLDGGYGRITLPRLGEYELIELT
ncbi:alpha-amylase family protein [Sphingomonas sp. dw_22]|uniref:alpha-amylase family protein n=1 Tax=Sphingomonas sp. dw_22 TaxID=2721175 RepID=UPI001BD25713|nr:alpha-amylase family protein [Sphingomonas sp. dw_22]